MKYSRKIMSFLSAFLFFLPGAKTSGLVGDPPKTSNKLNKFVERNKNSILTGCLLTLSLLGAALLNKYTFVHK
jgi:hypothetical protein